MKFDENGSQKCLIPYCWAKSDFWRPFSKVVKTLFWSTVWKRPFFFKKRHRRSKVFKLCFDSKTMSKQWFGVHKLIWLVFFRLLCRFSHFFIFLTWKIDFDVAFAKITHSLQVLMQTLLSNRECPKTDFQDETVFHHKFVISCQLTCLINCALSLMFLTSQVANFRIKDEFFMTKCKIFLQCFSGPIFLKGARCHFFQKPVSHVARGQKTTKKHTTQHR